MLVGDVIVGQGYLQNVVLVPGNNTLPIRAIFDLKTAIQNLPAILAAESGALADGNLRISASGNSTVVNGLHIPYYEAVLNSLVVTGEIPVAKLLVGSLQNLLGGSGNNTLIQNIISAFNGTDLKGILGDLTGNNSTSNSVKLRSLLTGLRL
jgi:hypothetical protein